MASVGRRLATADGQRHGVSLRSRDLSGIRSRGSSPLVYARNLLELRELIASVGEPCWTYGLTAAVLARFDGFVLEPPFHLVVPRDRSVNRIGHVIHRSRDISRMILDGLYPLQCTYVDVAGESPTMISSLREALAGPAPIAS